jgi:hypothetical protein
MEQPRQQFAPGEIACRAEQHYHLRELGADTGRNFAHRISPRLQSLRAASVTASRNVTENSRAL